MANDGGIFANSSQALTFSEPPPGPEPTSGHPEPPPGERETGPPPTAIGCDPSAGWVAAMSGLHTLATWGIAGVTQTTQCAGNEACPTLYLAQGDNDVFAVQQAGAISGPLNDNLGDAGEVFVDPAFPKQVVTTRQLLLRAVISTGDGPPGPGAVGIDMTPWDGVDSKGHKITLLTGGSAGPLNPGLTQVMALSGESNLSPLYFAIAGSPAHPDWIISNNAGPLTSQTWKTAETGSAVGMFPHGTVAQLRATGGLRNPVLWLLTTGGKVYKSAVTNGKVSQWQLVQGLGNVGSVFVNPYNPNYAWVMDFQDASIKMTTTGGTSWTPVPALKAIATNKGEYRFDCGWTSDVEFFDWTCSLAWMDFNRNHPNIVVAALFPGGVAYSNDSGMTWRPLPGATSSSPQTPPQQQNLRGLPVSVWYDDNPVTGTPSIYVGLNGRGIIRVDGAFNALAPE